MVAVNQIKKSWENIKNRIEIPLKPQKIKKPQNTIIENKKYTSAYR